MLEVNKKNIRLRYAAEKQLKEGVTIESMAHALGVCKHTFYRWHTKGLDDLPSTDDPCLYCHNTSSDAIKRWLNDGKITEAGLNNE